MDRKDLRAYNLQKLRDALRMAGQATQPQLAEMTGLSVMTVNALLRILRENHEAEMLEELLPSLSESGGRPARQYRYLSNRHMALVLSFYEKDGRNRVAARVQNLQGEIIFSEESVCSEVSLEFLSETIGGYCKEYSQLDVAIIGLPGVEVDGVLSVMDYPLLRGLRLREELTRRTGLPVFLANDVNAAVLGYGASLGADAKGETLVAVYWPLRYPPGAGILLRGELYQGRDGLAGEFAYAFSERAGYSSGNPVEQAAETVLDFVRYWNPHRMVFYHEGLPLEKEKDIRSLCAASMEERFLPEIVLGRSLDCDYERGLYIMADRLLRKLEEKGASGMVL